MNAHAEKIAAPVTPEKEPDQTAGHSSLTIDDHRATSLNQQKLQASINGSFRVSQLQKIQEGIDDSVVQRQVDVMQFVSSFQTDLSKDNHEIYMIYERTSPQELVQYVGRTNQGIDTRFAQHKASKPWIAAQNCAIDKLAGGYWTKFEVATHEQYWIQEAGGKSILENSINGIAYDKYITYRTPKGSAWNANQELRLWGKNW